MALQRGPVDGGLEMCAVSVVLMHINLIRRHCCEELIYYLLFLVYILYYVPILYAWAIWCTIWHLPKSLVAFSDAQLARASQPITPQSVC